MAEAGQSRTTSIRSAQIQLRTMQVTQEDGGRLNAFAKEPRMEVMDASASRSNGSRLLILGGAVLVLSLMAISAAIS